MKQAIFDEQSPIGILKGFPPLPEQLEVDVVMPADDRIYPPFGEFLLIEVDQVSALVGRVSRVQAAGQLMTEQGERYLADLAGANQDMPATVARQLLQYAIKMQLLGKLSLHSRSRFEFSVGERAFSSMGRRVRRPSREALNYLCNVGLDEDPTAAPLGELAYGQYAETSVKISLLNRTDLEILQRHNAHYTDDILGFIRNEPIQGNCYFWSAPNQPYVLPARVASFESVARAAPAQPSHAVEETTDRQAGPELGNSCGGGDCKKRQGLGLSGWTYLRSYRARPCSF